MTQKTSTATETSCNVKFKCLYLGRNTKQLGTCIRYSYFTTVFI